MAHDAPAYGLWSLALINIAVFGVFAFSFTRPRTARDWRSFGAFTAFLVALFTEMYGFPLTIYLVSGWLQSRYPGVDWLSHDAGHLLEMLFGWRANPHFGPFHVLSFLLIGGGFMLLARAWNVLYAAQRDHTLAMFPILVWMYVRLARREEREVRGQFGGAYARYAASTPAFVPRLGRRYTER